ncbi:hypothetical protein [Streptomyces sp. NPDC003719]
MGSRGTKAGVVAPAVVTGSTALTGRGGDGEAETHRVARGDRVRA